MTMKQNTDRISIQVGLSGYSFRIEADTRTHSSEWMSSDRVFTTVEFQKRYDEVELAVFTPKFTLVPAQFCPPEDMRRLLSEVTSVGEDEQVESVSVPEYNAVLLYSNSIGESLSKVLAETVLRTDGSKARPLPMIYNMLRRLEDIPEYNRILAAYMVGVLYLIIAQGRTLLLCNSFRASVFTTAQYFIYQAMKKLQLNPEKSTLTFMTHQDEEQEMSVYRYFRSGEHI